MSISGHYAPRYQPSSVRDLADSIFSAYEVAEGTVQLAGCQLQDRPFVRLTFRIADRCVQLLLDETGREVDDRRACQLGLDQLRELDQPLGRAEDTVEQLVGLGRRMLRERLGDAAILVEHLQSEVLWCKFVRGKLRFTIGSAEEYLLLSGWARTLTPPPVCCPQTGERTYHLDATDDGRIAAADQIVACAESNVRVLREELVPCAATGNLVLPELTGTCSATGVPVVYRLLAVCQHCHQKVSPTEMEFGRCSACDRFETVQRGDERLERILDRYPNLIEYRHWQLSETPTALMLIAGKWMRRVLIVLNKETLAPRFTGSGSKLSSGFVRIDEAHADDLLRKSPGSERSSSRM